MNVLSLCDGMSCGHIALKELGITVDRYYASEIDKNSIKVTQDNFPDTKQLGDVTKLNPEDLAKSLPKIDLVMFGSPCRSLSKATAGREQYNNGLKGISGLFYDCNEILKAIKAYNNPDVKFLVENVDSSKKDDLNAISTELGVQPVLINSQNFSAQDRKRLYWTNIPVDLSKLPSSSAVLGDVLEAQVDEKYFFKEDYELHGDDKRVMATLHINGHDILKRVYNRAFKAPTLTSCRGGNRQVKVMDGGRVRRLTPLEYRRLQTIPDWVKMDVANSHIYNMLGDGWTVKAIQFILSFM
jgi:DNA (cytosine-5)-methyltransferase 3A